VAVEINVGPLDAQSATLEMSEGMFAWAPSTPGAVSLEEGLDMDTFGYAVESADPDVHFAANALAGATVRLFHDVRLRLDAREWLSRLSENDENVRRAGERSDVERPAQPGAATGPVTPLGRQSPRAVVVQFE
jgi:hypothetical protein